MDRSVSLINLHKNEEFTYKYNNITVKLMTLKISDKIPILSKQIKEHLKKTIYVCKLIIIIIN